MLNLHELNELYILPTKLFQHNSFYLCQFNKLPGRNIPWRLLNCLVVHQMCFKLHDLLKLNELLKLFKLLLFDWFQHLCSSL